MSRKCIAAILDQVHLLLATIQYQAQSHGSPLSLTVASYYRWKTMSHCQQEAIYLKPVGGLSYKMAAELIFLYSFICDVFQIIEIGAAMMANGVHLISRSYDNRPTS